MGYVSFHRHRHLAVNSSPYSFWAVGLKTSFNPWHYLNYVPFWCSYPLSAPQTRIIALNRLIPSLSRGLPGWEESHRQTQVPIPLSFSQCLSLANLRLFSFQHQPFHLKVCANCFHAPHPAPLKLLESAVQSHPYRYINCHSRLVPTFYQFQWNVEKLPLVKVFKSYLSLYPFPFRTVFKSSSTFIENHIR